MTEKLSSRRHHLLLRRCVECGFDGPALQDGRAERCARCDCDLRERPAKSYAEMEGLLLQSQPVTQATQSAQRHSAMIERWLLLLFAAIVGVIAIGGLVAAALSF